VNGFVIVSDKQSLLETSHTWR